MRPAALIDLKRVRELSGQIAQHDGLIRIGARVTMTTLLGDERIRAGFPPCSRQRPWSARSRFATGRRWSGTSATHRLPPTLCRVPMVHGAVANIAGPSGDRRVPLSEFFVGPGRTVLQHTNSSRRWMPIPAGSAGAAFGRLTRRRGVDLAIINLCVLLGRAAGLLWRSAPLPNADPGYRRDRSARRHAGMD